MLYRYGFKKERVADSSVIADVMKTMKAYLNESINVYEYGYRIAELLNKPFDDKKAQRILQQRCEDAALLNAKRPPEYQKPYITTAEVKQRTSQALGELELLGYQA